MKGKVLRQDVNETKERIIWILAGVSSCINATGGW